MIQLITTILGLLLWAAKAIWEAQQDAKKRAADPVAQINEFQQAVTAGDEATVQATVADWANRGRMRAAGLRVDPPAT